MSPKKTSESFEEGFLDNEGDLEESEELEDMSMEEEELDELE